MSTANVTAKIAACRGGWPAALQPSSDKGKLLIAKNYVKTVCDKDISRAAKRNGALLRSKIKRGPTCSTYKKEDRRLAIFLFACGAYESIFP